MEFYLKVKAKAAVEAQARGWEKFHVSSTSIREHRPFWVKDPTRDVCLCRYHLQFDLLAKGLSRLRKAIECPNKCASCEQCPALTTGLNLRAALTCPRPDGEDRYDARACVTGECGKCNGMQRFDEIMCPARREAARDHVVKWEKYEKRFAGQDKITGEDKYKHDFWEQEGTGDELITEIGQTLKSFNPHHDLAKCQDDDWTYLKTSFPRRSFVSVQDFSENFHHTVRFEPQAKYYQSVDSTLYMVVVRYHLDDATRLPPAVVAELREAYESAGIPPIIVETLAIVSADLKHDNAFVRHVNECYVLPYMQSIGDFGTHYARSDGCKAQFKYATHFEWVSRQKIETGVQMDWSFFCSCHGKCDCDPEGGSIKNAAGNWENHGALDGMRVQAKLPTAASFVEWANKGSPPNSQHGHHNGLAKPPTPLKSRLNWGRKDAIFRRQFINLPITGPLAVRRNYAEVKLDGSASMHSFIDVGFRGTIQWRERSCHQCDNCFAGKPSFGCSNEAAFGTSTRKPITFVKQPESSLSRTLRSVESKSVSEMESEVVTGMLVCVAVPNNIHEPWMIGAAQGAVCSATEADVSEAAELGYSILEGSSVVRPTKYEPFEVGSRRYMETKVPLVVPSSALRRHQLTSNAEKELRKTAFMKSHSNRYGDSTFEIKEADLRAIVVVMAHEGVGDFKVDDIVGHRVVMQRGKCVNQFCVKWAGWDRPEDLTWEPLGHFTDAEHIAKAEQLVAGAAAQETVAEKAAAATRVAEEQKRVADKDAAARSRAAADKAAAERAAAEEAAAAAAATYAAATAAAAESAAAAASECAAAAAATSAAASSAATAAAATATAAMVAEKAAAQQVRGISTHTSLEDMLSLARMEEVPVVGDGNCGFYAFLATAGKIEHCLRQGRMGSPTFADYRAQQALRAQCVEWLMHREALVEWQLNTEDAAARPHSSWQPQNIQRLKRGKERAGDRPGVYANEPALRALAGIANEHLVVIDAHNGPSVDRERGQPYDRCFVYSPSDNIRALAKGLSWANNIVPVLVRLQDGQKLSTDPTYRVIVHNGEPPGSVHGHFSATRFAATDNDLQTEPRAF